METLHYLLMKAHTNLNRRILEGASALGLSPGQPKILEFLLDHGESNQKTIAGYCEIEQATVGSILLRMEQAGLISRRQKEGNRRSLYVSLTQKGDQAAKKMQSVFQTADAQATEKFSEQELQLLKQSLEKIWISVCRSEQNQKEGGEK